MVMFIGRWDTLRLLVMVDIVIFIVVSMGGVNVMYGIMFLLVVDLVVCVYVLYL